MVTRAVILFGVILVLSVGMLADPARLPAPETPAKVVKPCVIEIVEKGTGWAVPLVELRTTHHVRLVSDNAGRIVFDLPELMNRPTWFTVIGHGYEAPRDGFGLRGVRLTPAPGKTLRVELTRSIIARRLGRLTGAGLFAESQKAGLELDAKESGIVGCDSVLTARFGKRLFWVWGDTTLARYPLGIFDTLAATTATQPLSSFKPPLRPGYRYITDKAGMPRAVARMPGKGPTWLTGLVSVEDTRGVQRLVSSYMKIKPPLEVYEWGLCEWNEKTSNFDRLKLIWTKSAAKPKPPPIPQGHPVRWKDKGKTWLLFGNPLPTLRCPATYEGWKDPETWEVLKPQATLKSPAGATVKPHSGSIAWNGYRKRWVTVFMEHFGKPSVFGEVWYAEADSPTGPWGTAVKVLSHANYTFYNPLIHADWTEAKSPILLFEGTYTKQFANRPPATARYEYNQMLYRLDLDDKALAAARK